MGFGTVDTNAAGSFQFVVDSSSISLSPVIIKFQVTTGATTLLDSTQSFAWVPDFVGQIVLYVDTEAAPELQTYTVKGTVVHANGVFADNAPVKVFLEEFQTRTELALTYTDENGNYETELTADLFGSVLPDLAGISVDVLNSGETESIATSNIVSVRSVVVVDITLEPSEDTPHPFMMMPHV